MASLAHRIDPSLRIGGVLEYIQKRTKIRQHIANETGISVELVKEIFSAMGFGAKLRNNPYNAIRRALDKEARKKHDKSVWLEKDVWNNLGAATYERLIGNQSFMYIYENLQQINKTILHFMSDKDIVIGDAVYSDIDPNADEIDEDANDKDKKKNLRTDLQKLAWIYQAYETQAREQLEQLSGQKALLTTHDCIYFKQKLPTDTVLSITYQLQQTYQYLRFEHEAIYPIADDETYNSRFAEQIEFEREHKERMKALEEEHRNYESPLNFCEKFLKPHDVKVEYDYETLRREQFLRDVGCTVIKIGDRTIMREPHNVDDEEDDYWEASTERQYWREEVVD